MAGSVGYICVMTSGVTRKSWVGGRCPPSGKTHLSDVHFCSSDIFIRKLFHPVAIMPNESSTLLLQMTGKQENKKLPQVLD